jgi:hypothetical protein
MASRPAILLPCLFGTRILLSDANSITNRSKIKADQQQSKQLFEM